MSEQKSIGQVAYEILQSEMQPVYGGERLTWDEACKEEPRFGRAFEEFAVKFRAEVLGREIEKAAGEIPGSRIVGNVGTIHENITNRDESYGGPVLRD